MHNKRFYSEALKLVCMITKDLTEDLTENQHKKHKVSRRDFLTGASSIAAAGAAGLLLNGCLSFVQRSPVTLLLPATYESPSGLSGWWYEGRLRDAAISLIKIQYEPDRTVPLWKERFSDINFILEERIDKLSAWACEGARRSKKTYSVDPALLMAGMYVESRFYEYAISSALAVGVSQFIAHTAREKPYEMICAGDLPEHHAPPFQMTEYAGAQQQYEQFIRELREIRNEQKKTGKHHDTTNLELAIMKARQDFNTYFLTNVARKSVLDDGDTEFLSGFDQRSVYEHAVPSMAQFIAANLKAKNGNVLAAWAGYNAGLGNTRGNGFLKPYGSLPNGGTATYAQEIVLIADWLNRRIFG